MFEIDVAKRAMDDRIDQHVPPHGWAQYSRPSSVGRAPRFFILRNASFQSHPAHPPFSSPRRHLHPILNDYTPLFVLMGEQKLVKFAHLSRNAKSTNYANACSKQMAE